MKKIFTALLVILMAVGCAGAETVFDPLNATDGKLKALELLEVCAFSSEFGERTEGGPLIRWEEPLRIYVGGNPTQEDVAFLDEFLIELSFRVPLLPPVYRVYSEDEANITVYYAPMDELDEYVTDFIEGNWGMVTFFYSNYCLYDAEIGIANDVTTQEDRNHIVMEEIVGGIGLGNDHYVYSDSIIYQPWSNAQQLSEVDWLMLNMVYSPVVKPGMSYEQVRGLLLPLIY